MVEMVNASVWCAAAVDVLRGELQASSPEFKDAYRENPVLVSDRLTNAVFKALRTYAERPDREQMLRSDWGWAIARFDNPALSRSFTQNESLLLDWIEVNAYNTSAQITVAYSTVKNCIILIVPERAKVGDS